MAGLNPYGAVWAIDWGSPKILSGKARETISGGQLVAASGATGVISSGLDSYITTDIEWSVTTVSGTNFTGVALKTGVSGDIIPVAVEGGFILNSRGTTTAGTLVGAAGDDAVTDAGAFGAVCGRALTTAGSNTFALISIFG